MRRFLFHIVPAIGALATIDALNRVGGSQSLLNGVTLWTLLPYVLFGIVLTWTRTRVYRFAFQIVTVLAVIIAVYCYRESRLHPDAQGALVFLFVPLYQLAAFAMAAVAVTLIRAGQCLRLWSRSA